jgi:hypothetical protein
MLLRGEGNTGTFISLSRKRHDCSSLKASRYTPNFAGKDWNPSSPPGISSSRLSCVDRQNPWHDSGTVSGARATAALLTTAFHEQFYSIGWFHFQLGCLSKHWGKAYKDLTLDATDGSTQRWMSTVISQTWKYIGDIWSLRNEIVHGAMAEDQARKFLE